MNKINTPLFLFCKLTLLSFKCQQANDTIIVKIYIYKKVADKGACLKKLAFKWNNFSKNLI